MSFSTSSTIYPSQLSPNSYLREVHYLIAFQKEENTTITFKQTDTIRNIDIKRLISSIINYNFDKQNSPYTEYTIIELVNISKSTQDKEQYYIKVEIASYNTNYFRYESAFYLDYNTLINPYLIKGTLLLWLDQLNLPYKYLKEQYIAY